MQSDDLSGRPTDKNRMAELAVELMGAKLTAEFVREAWEAASPDAKRAIADALVQRVTAQIEAADWTVVNAISAFVAPMIEDLLAPHRDEIRAQVSKRLEESMPTMVEAVTKRATETMRSELADKCESAVRDAMRGYRSQGRF